MSNTSNYKNIFFITNSFTQFKLNVLRILIKGRLVSSSKIAWDENTLEFVTRKNFTYMYITLEELEDNIVKFTLHYDNDIRVNDVLKALQVCFV